MMDWLKQMRDMVDGMNDKVKHFVAGVLVAVLAAGIALMMGAGDGAPVAGAVVGMLAAVTKEVHDSHFGGDPSRLDAFASVAGAVVAMMAWTLLS